MTRNASSVTVVATLFGMILMAGCFSSEGTSPGGRSTAGPERSIGPIDTARKTSPLQLSVEKKSTATTKRSPRSTKFTARQDTLRASVVRRNKESLKVATIERPTNPAYTVQLGAFVRPNNALRNQKIAKSRFSKYPVYSKFDARSNFYRVSVGKFITRREAARMRREILNQYPKEYSACWVNYIAR